MKRNLILLVSLFIGINVNVRAQENIVKADELSEWAHYLASDEMKGRANGSEEMKMAAGFIAEKFAEFGLTTLPGINGYIQEYSFASRRNGEINESNVIGFLEGSDPNLKDEFIIFSSHFDHIGIGKPVDGDSIYNGANDNVAGTVTNLGLAKLWHEKKIRPARSVIFVAFSGEELGMKGSTHFFNNLTIKEEKIFLNLNMEMTGHCTNLGAHRYYITGPSYTNLDEILDEYNANTDWKVSDKEPNADGLLFASDNVVFALDRSGDEMKLNIPAHTWCTHGGEEHIHRPNDEPQFMNYENMADLVTYLSGLGIYFGKMEAGSIKWDHVAFKEAMAKRRR